MHSLLPSLIAAVLYLGAAGYQISHLSRRLRPNTRLLCGLGLLGLLSHMLSLSQHLLPNGQLHLEFFNAGSLVSATVILLTLLASFRMPLENLLIPLLPMGALTVLGAQFAPSGSSNPLTHQPGVMLHILLSICAYGLLTIAMFQALLLQLQDHQLKNKHPSGLIRNFPPLQTMESLLFGFLWAGWGLLTLSLLSGWLFMENMMAQHLAHKTLLSGFAWIVFAGLLWGRWQLGWRGHTAIRGTLAGFCLLMLAYFGSKLVREFIVHL